MTSYQINSFQCKLVPYQLILKYAKLFQCNLVPVKFVPTNGIRIYLYFKVNDENYCLGVGLEVVQQRRYSKLITVNCEVDW